MKPEEGESALIVELLSEKRALNDVWEMLEQDFSQKDSKLEYE